MATPSPSLSGRCACGSVTFHSTSKATNLDFCYCTQCQRVSGAPFVPWLAIPKSALTWTGPVSTLRLSKLASRGFCAQCGATLTMEYDSYPDRTHVAAGLVERSDWEMPAINMHIFVKFKPQWFRIGDESAPRYEEWDEGTATFLPDVVKEWKDVGKMEG